MVGTAGGFADVVAGPVLAATAGAAEALRSVARDVEAAAGDVRVERSRLRAADAASWRSSAALLYRRSHGALVDRAEHDARLLEDLATALRAHAAAVEDRGETLRQQVARAELVLARAGARAEEGVDDAAHAAAEHAEELVRRATEPFRHALGLARGAAA